MLPKGRRRTRPWADLRGPTKQANAIATLLREWLDEADMRVDDVLASLKPEHFVGGRVPSRSTVSDRLAGVGLKPDFIEAMADVCSRDMAGRVQLIGQVQALQEVPVEQGGSGIAGKARGSRPEGGALAGELVLVQQRSLAVSDKLMRALERATELERERNSANQMVLLLLAMVDKLQRDIATLTRERDRLRTSVSEQTAIDVRARLVRSEQQRTNAESELERARAERHKADRLAEEAAEQVRALTQELERLRGQAPGTEAPRSSETPPALQEALDSDGDDIDQALAKAARHLDDGAGRLDRLAEELHQEDPLDNSLDNPATSSNMPDISPVNQPPHGQLTGSDLVEIIRTARRTDGDHIDVPGILMEAAHDQPCDSVLDSVALLRQAGYDGEADQLLGFAGESWPLDEVPAFIGTLRADERHTDAYQLLTAVGRQRSASDVVEVVAALRDAEHDADAYQVLTAVGRVRPATGVIDVLKAALLHDDTQWILDAAARDRDLAKLPRLIDALHEASRHPDAEPLSVAYGQRLEESAQAARGTASGHQAEFEDIDDEEDEEENVFFRPYRSRRPQPQPYEERDMPAVRPYMLRREGSSPVSLPIESVVSTVAVAAVVRSLLPEHQRICSLCHDPQSIVQISDQLALPLGVALILVADLAAEGHVTISPPPTATGEAQLPRLRKEP